MYLVENSEILSLCVILKIEVIKLLRQYYCQVLGEFNALVWDSDNYEKKKYEKKKYKINLGKPVG